MPARTRGRYRSALRSRDLRVLLAAFTVDAIGSWAYNVVLVVYVFDRTGSAGMIAVTTACGWLPRLLFSAYAGVLADRYERSRVMVMSALVCSAVTFALAAVLAVDGPLAIVLGLHALIALCNTPYAPAVQAVVPDTVPEEDLAPANALFGSLENLVTVAGPAIGALLLLTGEPEVGVLLDAVTFLLAAVMLSRLRVRSRGDAADGRSPLGRQLAAGVAALRAERTALVLTVYCALDSAVYGALTVLFVPLSVKYGTGPDGYGYLLASMALGGVLAAGLVNQLASAPRLAPVIVGGMCLLALPVALAAQVPWPVLGALVLVISGAGMLAVDVLAVTALQRDVPSNVLSRVFGILNSLVLAAILLSSAATSALLSVLSLEATAALVGLGIAAVSVAGMAPLLRADRSSADDVRLLGRRVALLEGLDLFAGATRPTMEQLARSAQEVELADGDVAVAEGDPADALYVLVHGTVTVTARGSLLAELSAPAYFGEIGVLRGVPRTATVTAAEPVSLWRVSGADFLTALETGSASPAMLGTVSARLARGGVPAVVHPAPAGA
ncbi:MFS transporter [Motilibacter sp. E257]|uniref:MFS transporter n=1 Tax=Motilibacter deserti TaxID=2714956 RepID=A0ABX0GY10_9ACTN|nr:MFS transporter [Motilibacter deserti]